MKLSSYPRLLFPQGFDERSAFEMTSKGYVSAQVETADGAQHPVFFYDPVRLQQDLESVTAQGEPCLTEPGLVILPEVTVEAAERAVQFLWQRGFFAGLNAERSNERQAELELVAA